ncbi:hypothetical protein ANO14919_144840 [Xylariales sp. No.14919]|nr:hypothetical protein ANO14919_144840 [Xylariales sp. No.14919]
MAQIRQTRDVAVIGAGVSGLAVAKQLMAENLTVVVYERQRSPGGVWNYSTDPKEMFPTPMYENLETNFPRELMEFADHKWPSTTSLFPKSYLVQAYLHKYSDGINIHYGREVSGLYGLGNYAICGGKRWRVIARNENERRRRERDFDAVVIATGTFDRTFEPDYSGLDEWKTRYPNSVLHSKSYRNPRRFRGKVRF